MKNTQRITNLQQLEAEIELLRLRKAEQELFFKEKKERFNEALKSPFTFFKKASRFLTNNQNIHSDWATALARVSIPFLLNKTLLRGKGALLKSILTLISQKAINPAIFNQTKLFGAVEKVSDWVSKIMPKKKKKETDVDYGIPPDSETY
ncbi:hypothetical protein Pedsa_2778 [Pseudopedobacter saltans DSM 12145]|uniref:Uncharacterized protein n=1 Tax=Pseudopedobacter saltans (strain ATCC 51119 / DSM 12145 / JCM 21818 / CCUG 39354 / LMG 10337 / NBRC 100064 / NCIMB 13643) TaxID=762903 RepID=F0S7R4_PSESL|nr:hypothetical protein [Pseudopedobacter saltans]ADY53319.1 hypothetical protein Pedsa_2778 [Pseudopedobacter saltans DSM 12145]